MKKDEPRPAPKYQSDAELLQSIRQDRPDLADAAIKKDSQLLTKLESIYVTSEDPEHFDIETDNNRKRYINPDRPMPEKGVQSVCTCTNFSMKIEKLLVEKSAQTMNLIYFFRLLGLAFRRLQLF